MNPTRPNDQKDSESLASATPARAIPGRATLPRRPGSAGASPYREAAGQRRGKPAQDVHIYSGQPTIVFVTVCAKDRARWLACDEVHRLLAEIWRLADAWLVGGYVLMPDHVHFFAAPHDLRFTIEQWVTFWKSSFSKSHAHPEWQWQDHSFHHRLRRDESYSQKLVYARENPMRAGLAERAEEWPYQGTIHNLRW
jgi:putative transposase